jgi:hypothetical protein
MCKSFIESFSWSNKYVILIRRKLNYFNCTPIQNCLFISWPNAKLFNIVLNNVVLLAHLFIQTHCNNFFDDSVPSSHKVTTKIVTQFYIMFSKFYLNFAGDVAINFHQVHVTALPSVTQQIHHRITLIPTPFTLCQGQLVHLWWY